MNTHFQTYRSLAVVAAVCCFFGSALRASAQEPKAIGDAFLPTDAAATMIMRVSETLSSPQTELYPIEIANSWCQQNIGMTAEDIETVQVITAVPGPTGPMVAAVIRLKQDFNLAQVNAEMVNAKHPVDVDGNACYPINAPLPAMLHEYDKRTIILATPNYMDSVIRAGTDDRVLGPLAELADATPPSGQVSLLISMEPVRPIAINLLQNAGDQIPPPLQGLAQLPNLVDAMVLSIDIGNTKAGQRLTMLASDASAAKELERTLNNGILSVRDMLLQIAIADVNQDDPVAAASQQYMKRVADHMVKVITPRQSGREVIIEGTLNPSMTTNGVLVGLLLPAVQAARASARRISSVNNMRQIGLAMHNHYDVYRTLPGNIVDKNGKALLSWRVKILPFIEEQALYDQFHLDEPWDSEHNIKLLSRMPDIYVDPNTATQPGMTVYQRPIGEKLIMNSDAGGNFRKITDGTSNTIMTVETLPDAAAAWTKPEDLTIDLNKPKSKLFDGKRAGFNALLADGSALYLGDDIDASLLKALLTARGGEVTSRSEF